MSKSPAPGLIHQIRQQCADAYALYDAGGFKDALRLFYQAWLLLPKPQTEHQAAGWVLTAIGDTYFRLTQYDQGREALTSALHCPHAEKSGFVHLRLGQCLWELGQVEGAHQALLEAYQVGGRSLFAAEDEKYLQSISPFLHQDQRAIPNQHAVQAETAQKDC